MTEEQQLRLKVLLHRRRWQTHRTFCREYDRVAKTIDPDLVGSWPSRAQLHRWLAGNVKGLPYPDHCRVLEAMFPEWSVEQLFEVCSTTDGSEAGKVLGAVAAGFESPDAPRTEWGPSEGGSRASTAEPVPASTTPQVDVDPLSEDVGRRLLSLGQQLRLPMWEVEQLASLAGHFVHLGLQIDIDVDADRQADVAYRYHVLNLTSRPIPRIQLDLWFEFSVGKLTLSPISEGNRNVAIEPIHEAPNLAKFNAQVSPPIQPGEEAHVGYRCTGGIFSRNLYWRQDVVRYTRKLTINLRHRGVGQLVSCSATEDQGDGSEISAADRLTWDYDGDDVCVSVTRDYLRPKQALTLRWEI